MEIRFVAFNNNVDSVRKGNAAFRGVGADTARRLKHLLLKQYVKRTRHLRHKRRIILHMDATTHSGESTEVALASLPRADVSCYVPVQVPRRGDGSGDDDDDDGDDDDGDGDESTTHKITIDDAGCDTDDKHREQKQSMPPRTQQPCKCKTAASTFKL